MQTFTHSRLSSSSSDITISPSSAIALLKISSTVKEYKYLFAIFKLGKKYYFNSQDSYITGNPLVLLKLENSLVIRYPVDPLDPLLNEHCREHFTFHFKTYSI